MPLRHRAVRRCGSRAPQASQKIQPSRSYRVDDRAALQAVDRLRLSALCVGAWLADRMAPWLSAIAASLALIATTTTLTLSLLDRRRAQAGQVSTHVNVLLSSKPPFATLSVAFYNLSSLPVTDVGLRLTWRGAHVGEPETIASIPPQNADFVQPRIDKWINQTLRPAVLKDPGDADQLGLSLSFTDSNGRRWSRDHLGRLKAVRGRENPRHRLGGSHSPN